MRIEHAMTVYDEAGYCFAIACLCSAGLCRVVASLSSCLSCTLKGRFGMAWREWEPHAVKEW